MPEVYAEFQRIGQQLEKHYRDVQDLEFTIERGRLYMLQTRSAKRTAAAAVRIAVDMVDEGLITKDEAIARIEPAHVDQLLRDQFDPTGLAAATRVAKGLNASPGAAVGRAVFSADTAVEWVGRGEQVVLVRVETSPDDFHGMAVAQGILTARGGATSHAAVVARQIGKPCVAGCAELVIDYSTGTARSTDSGATFGEGDWISVDGATGQVYLGALPDGLRAVRGPARAPAHPRLGRRHPPHGRLDQRRQARGGRPGARLRRRRGSASAGPSTCSAKASGSRSCATRSSSPTSRRGPRRRPPPARRSTPTRPRRSPGSTRRWPSSRSSSRATSRASSRRWTGCRWSSASSTRPSTSSCPNLEEQLVKVTKAGDAATAEDKELLATIKSLHEQNPMLGLRGCRLGLMFPDFVKIQTRAILNAQIAVKRAGGNPIAKIMIPLVGHVNELARTRALLEAEATAVEAKAGVEVDYKFGTMIEVPRGALTADEIAKEADFFSFGTNDLTQMTFGYSRDDAEGGFLLKYVEDGILPVNPFQTLDDAVAGLMKVAVDKGRSTKPDLELGICGEHGGDPASIAKCERIGLDYVSCSPFRVPVARLAAAQAVLTSAAERDK